MVVVYVVCHVKRACNPSEKGDEEEEEELNKIEQYQQAKIQGLSGVCGNQFGGWTKNKGSSRCKSKEVDSGTGVLAAFDAVIV